MLAAPDQNRCIKAGIPKPFEPELFLEVMRRPALVHLQIRQFWLELCEGADWNAQQEGQTVMSETGRYPLSAEAEHRLLTLMTVANLNLALLRKHLQRPETHNRDENIAVITRIERAQRSMVDIIRELRDFDPH
jgi:hypothetical protein